MENTEFFCDKTDDELRSLHFFLLLNTDLGITEELEGNADVGHAIGAVPAISAYVYVHLCAELDLANYLKEVIEFGPLKIVCATLDQVGANLRYVQSFHYNVLASILAALFARFQRIEAPSIPQTLFDTFQVFLLRYTEDEAAMDSDSRLEAGHKWLSLIRLVRHTCRVRFVKKWKIAPPEFYDIKIEEPKGDKTNKNEAVVGFFDRILYKCRAFADILDANLFMAWHEFEVDGGTMQSIIGVEAYKLRVLLEKCSKIHTLPAEASELIQILRSVQREPDKGTPTKEEKLDADELKDRIIKNSEYDSKFISEAERVIKEYPRVLDSEMIKTFVRKLCSNSGHKVKEESIKNLVWLLLGRMEFNDITLFLGEFVESYGLSSILQQTNIDLSSHIRDINDLNTDDEEKTVKVLIFN